MSYHRAPSQFGIREMGIKDLLQHFEGDFKQICQLESLRGRCLGLDVSNYLMKFLRSSQNVAAYFVIDPPLDLSQLVRVYWNDLHKKFQLFGISIIMVFDGARNPAKLATNDERRQTRMEYEHQVLEIIDGDDENDREELYKALKNCTYIRDDILLATVKWAKDANVLFMCAPMEAEWQLVQLEKDGITDGSISEDTDLIPLGSKLMVKNIDYKNNTFVSLKPLERWNDYFKDHMSNNATGTVWRFHDLIAYCIFLGCDFANRVKNIGPERIKTLMVHWTKLSWNGKMNLVRYLEVFGKIPSIHENMETFFQVQIPEVESYSMKFWRSFFIFKHPPVYSAVIFEGKFVNVDLKLMGGELDHDDNTLLELLGEDMSFCYLSMDDIAIQMHASYAVMDNYWWIRRGSSLLESQPPKVVPWYAGVNFDTIPAKFMPNIILDNFLEVRGIVLSMSEARSRLIHYVTRAIARRKPVLVIKEYPLPNAQGNYINENRFRCVDNQPIVWDTNLDNIVAYLRSDRVMKIDKKFVATLWFGGTAIRARATRLYKGGHVILSSAKLAQCLYGTSSNSRNVSVIRITVAPSMKSACYTVTLAFDNATNEYLRPPVSSCECPGGPMMCSHSIASLLLFLVVQSNTDSVPELLRNLPASVTDLLAINIPFEYYHG